MLMKRLIAAGWITLILMFSIAAALLFSRPPSPLAAAERLVEALAFRFCGPARSAAAKVVVIGITEETLSAFPYRSPLDRGFLASVIDTLARGGVTAIGLDIVLDRPTEAAKDAALRQALTRTDVPIVAISVGPDTDMTAAQRRFLAEYLKGVRTGDANLARDRFDDTIRDHVPLDPSTGQPSFPAAIAAAIGVPVPQRSFPIEWRRGRNGQAGPVSPTYPADSIGLLPPGWLKGKVALVGSLVAGSDEHRTLGSMFGQPSFGVDIHAQVVEQLLDRRAAPALAVRWLELLATVALACIGVGLGLAAAGAIAVGTMIAVSLGFAAAALAVYAYSGTLIPIVAPVVAVGIAGGAARGWRGLADRRDRRALRALFSRFVSEPVVDQIMQERDLFMSGGRPRPQELTATVLYADVAGFTGICERLAPEPLIAWLDRYIDTMAGVIMAHDGVLLRFVGDGILAVFGVPVPRRDEAGIATDASNAARCALAMEQAMEALNDGWAGEGLPVGGLRVGLHTGPMVAGSLGTGARMEFCLLGDTANVGARLEQLGKDHAEPTPRYCTIVVGEPTWLLLGGAFPGLLIGNVMLRGRNTTMAAYRIDAAAVRQAVRRGAPTVPPLPDLRASPDRLSS
ncbi:MAG TPA: adenylate/guanylate cyclase domain-containing protein [Rhodopila sp.]|jgi:class 3 adenylate cyclase